MKKIFKAFIFLSLLFTSCNGIESSKQIESTTSSLMTNSSIESSLSTNQDAIPYGIQYESTSWDNGMLHIISYITGENKEDYVPKVTANRFVYGIELYEQTDAENNIVNSIDLLIINCYGFNNSNIIDDYEDALLDSKYSLSSDSLYGYKELDNTKDLIIQYDLTTDNLNQECFQLLVYSYEYRIDYWPEQLIKDIIGENVPQIDASSYEVTTDLTLNNEIRLSICAFHSNTTIKEYESRLINMGYIIQKNNYLNEAISSSGTVHVMYSSYSDTFTIYIYNEWPYADIVNILGFDLPRLEEGTFSFNFINDGNSQVLVLYYENVDVSVLSKYGTKLETIGFKLEGEEETTSSSTTGYTYTSRSYIIENDGKEEHYIYLTHCLELSTLAIAIYY